ncbi:MAG: hypothetical protein EAZ24_09500 [Burkholderiales bacterium]|nr:MAG: hypothetical protein EAZ24_09500 [Burkholderiales bacterium]TAG84402.1 MAG: hypothetical protein EAZ21_00520 [Betaproteobacteria bacterium]
MVRKLFVSLLVASQAALLPQPALAADAPSARVAAPELAPPPPDRENARVSNRDLVAQERGKAQADEAVAGDSREERIESRLAIIRERGYTITDPGAGRYDRATSNGQRRVSPSMWQIFRF